MALLNEDSHNYLIHAIEKNSHLAHAASSSGAKLGSHVLKMIGDLSSFLRWLVFFAVTTSALPCGFLCLCDLVPLYPEYLTPQSHVYTSLERLQSLLSAKFFVLHFVSSYSVLMTNRYLSYDLEYSCSTGAWKSEPSQNLRNNRVCVCSSRNEIGLHLDGLSECYCLHSLLMNDDTC